MRNQLAFAQFGAAARRMGALMLGLVMCTLGPGLCASAKQGTFITIDPPGSVFTQAYSINPAGAITGTYCDAVTCHGFLRTADGTITTFDAPDDVFGTCAMSINPAGAITGGDQDSTDIVKGFLRTPDGTVTEFDPPNDCCGLGFSGPFVVSINPAGAITGNYTISICSSGCVYTETGFLRASDGTITGAVGRDGYGGGTFAQSINPAGAITGFYTDASGANHGFLWTP